MTTESLEISRSYTHAFAPIDTLSPIDLFPIILAPVPKKTPFPILGAGFPFSSFDVFP